MLWFHAPSIIYIYIGLATNTQLYDRRKSLITRSYVYCTPTQFVLLLLKLRLRLVGMRI